MEEKDIHTRQRALIIYAVVVSLLLIAVSTAFVISEWNRVNNGSKESIEDSSFVDISESTPETNNSSMPKEPENIPDKVVDEKPEEFNTDIPEVTEPVETEPEIDPNDIELLACVIYQEAGADYVCDDCRRRVADVVLNRVNSEYFPDTIYEVLTQPSQYGRYHWTGVVWPSRSGSVAEANAVARAYRIAEEVLRGQHSELYDNGYIWQAEFSQGEDNIYCCGIYFGR